VSDEYVFSAAERNRISAVEDLLDDGTMRLIMRLGIGPGARCLEVGAGGGSIARWLAELAGAEGSVVATDVDIRLMASTEAVPNIEIRRHDVVRDPLEERAFDFVHARLVLEHLPERDAVLEKLTRALRPGGWLLVEDTDYAGSVPVTDFGAAEHERVQSVRMSEFARMGIDHFFGRRLPGRLRALGLLEVGNEGRVWIQEGGSPAARWLGLSLAHLRGRLVGLDKLTDAELDRMIELCEDPNWAAFSPIIIGAWGRRSGTAATLA
jgi:SAM-dependent methyltransferase